MRRSRTSLEQHYASAFLTYLRNAIRDDISEINGVTDKPDVAFRIGDQVIGVELSQFPSSYIMSELHRPRRNLAHTGSSIEGHVGIYPFEPHRWVSEVISKKSEKVPIYQSNVGADETWLLLHGRSADEDWPMSRRQNRDSRNVEAELLRFGATGPTNNFDKVFFIYADGEVVQVADASISAPVRVSLPKSSGYPAVTMHFFYLSIDMPAPEDNVKTFRFEEINFEETIVEPIDDWMASRLPDIERPNFRVCASVTPTSISATVYRGSTPTQFDPLVFEGQEGKTVDCYFALTWGIKKTTFLNTFESSSDE